MIKINYKKLAIAVALIFISIAIIVYILFRGMSLDNYSKLDSCLRASVSERILCTQNEGYVSLKNISQDLVQPIITSEDDKFYFHDGFDWKEFRASVTANLRAFSFVRGGSTITQQLVKNIYLSQEKSITRKIKEAVLASQIEGKYTKSLILEKYLNAIEFGPNIWGIKKAAQYYFKKSPKDLEILEGVYLAVLLPSPKRYSKSFDNKKLTPYLKRRMKTILYWLKRKKYLDEVDYDMALENINFFPWDKEPLIDIELYDLQSDTDLEIDDDNSLNFEKKLLTEPLDDPSEETFKQPVDALEEFDSKEPKKKDGIDEAEAEAEVEVEVEVEVEAEAEAEAEAEEPSDSDDSNVINKNTDAVLEGINPVE